MSLDDSDAQKYINDAVKDGGGCTEAWEAMTEVRNQLDDNSRRKFLKRTAATAGIALTGVSTVSAKGREEHQELDVDIEYVLKSDQVQLILDELGHPTPQRVNDSNFSTKGPFDIQLDKVTSEMAISEEGSKASSTRIPTTIGDIVAIMVDGQLTNLALFRFDKNLGQGERNRISISRRIGWPDSTQASLMASSDELAFMRSLSDREKRRAMDALELDSLEVSGAFVKEKSSGYSVTDAAGSGSVLDTEFNIVQENTLDLFDSEHKTQSEGKYTTQANCRLKLVECFSVFVPLPAGCAGCVYACGFGPLACITCAVAICGPVLLLYGACAGVQNCV